MKYLKSFGMTLVVIAIILLAIVGIRVLYPWSFGMIIFGLFWLMVHALMNDRGEDWDY